MLHQLVRENLAFLAEAAERYPSGELPPFLAGGFERYLSSGILERGFARVRCATCCDELLVAFSCKNRGVCPSCSAGRMADTAAHLRDQVFPAVPLRDTQQQAQLKVRAGAGSTGLAGLRRWAAQRLLDGHERIG